MTDVVPELKKAIDTSFQSNMMKDRQIASISKRIRDGTATLVDGHKYAEQVGKNLSKALKDNLTAETLPDGKLYYNIAKRTVVPSLEKDYQLVNKTAAQIQAIEDAKKGIGLQSIQAKFPDLRVSDLIDKMTEDEIELEEALKWVGEPIVNNSEAFFDDYIRANADFRSESGMQTTITRHAESGCCGWCSGLTGTYEYGNAPDDIYQRHEYCRCAVTYESKKLSIRQDVWSKQTWSTAEELETRKNYGR